MEGTTSAIVMHRIVASIEIKTGPMRGAPTIGGTGYYTTHMQHSAVTGCQSHLKICDICRQYEPFPRHVSPEPYRLPPSQPASQPVGLCRTCCIGTYTGKRHVLLSVAVMEKKVKMRSGGILIVVAIVQVLGNLFAFDANPTWKSCLPDSRPRHRGTGKWKARLLYLARFVAVLFACGVSTSVIPNWYHMQNCAAVCHEILGSLSQITT